MMPELSKLPLCSYQDAKLLLLNFKNSELHRLEIDLKISPMYKQNPTFCLSVSMTIACIVM